MPRSYVPTEDEKVKLFRDSVYYEIIHTFGVPVELTESQLSTHTIGETINYSRYVHGRLLSHFLLRLPKNLAQDDACAADFGFDPATSGLTEDEIRTKTAHVDLNKGLLHLTYGRVTGATSKPWNTVILKELLPVAILFMEHIRDNEILPGGEQLFANPQERDGWKRLLVCLKLCQQKKRLRFASGFLGTRTWYRPTTEDGFIDTLYGTQARETPDGAVVHESLTNTTSSVIITTFRDDA